MAGIEMPLTDVTVVDFGQAIAGPICATFLADLGANVIKVERPAGDVYRINRRERDGIGFNPPFEAYNRNKRGLCVDVKSEEGLKVVYDLIEDSDMLVQNWPPGVAEKLSLDYETVLKHNPEIIYVHVTGYGETGPSADQPAMDTIIQHVSGYASLLGDEEDNPPMRSQSSLADFYAGYNGALSALAALRHRDKGNGGQKIDISMLHSLMHNADGAFEYHNMLGEELPRGGRNSFALPDMLYGAAEAKDGWIAVALLVYSDRIWRAFCELIDRPDLLEDADYQSDAKRMEDAGTFTALFEEWLAEQTVDEAMKQLREAGIPAGRHNTISEAASMEHVEETDVFVDIDHPKLDTVRVTDSPLSLSEGEPAAKSHSPLRGEHNEEVLREMGYGDEEIEQFRAENILSEE